jgi:tetratricopeptide (TPR) repeat protein
MAARSTLAGVVTAALLGTHVAAIMMTPDIRKVPVDRLLPNLERIANENPQNPQPQINLARLHVMAYALKSEAADAVRGPDDKQTTDIPYYPPGSTVPRSVQPSPSAEHSAKAAEHLKQAIQHYDAALKLAPDNLTALLGRGWARQQAGDTTGAIADLRRVIATAWPHDSKTKMLMPSQRFITQEAIDYLLPLLDQKRDAAEIQDLQSKQTDLKNRPRAITPLAIPLEDNLPPSAIVDPLARARFDADGSALDREWTWITPQAGWLVYDWNDRGEITSALQLFGNVTFWLFWSNGYDALGALDDDGNRRIEGAELRHLAVWQDGNVNGRSERGEVLSLDSLDIAALSVDYCAGDGGRIAAYAPRGLTLRDGRTRPTYDVILEARESGARKLTRK